jgi:hypothetical protein
VSVRLGGGTLRYQGKETSSDGNSRRDGFGIGDSSTSGALSSSRLTRSDRRFVVWEKDLKLP